jgi:hypothetical protein
MTVYTLQASIPPIRLVPGMIVKLEAINPTTGAAITGVTASRWAIYGSEIADDTVQKAEPAGPYILVPGPKNIETAA